MRRNEKKKKDILRMRERERKREKTSLYSPNIIINVNRGSARRKKERIAELNRDSFFRLAGTRAVNVLRATTGSRHGS